MGPLPLAAQDATAADAAEAVTTAATVPQAGAGVLDPQRRRWQAAWLCGACPAASAVQLLPAEQQCPSCRGHLTVRLRST